MKRAGLYIHIPFCDGKCRYCNFFSTVANENGLDEYTSRLINKLSSSSLDRSVDTIYFGGGTPSLLGDKRLSKILDCITGSFNVDQKAEITLEANPSSSYDLNYKALRNAGFNRLSIGLQSSNDNELRTLGRRHTKDDAVKAVSAAYDGGFDNISLDVMLAIPGQTCSSLRETLKFCKSCEVKHISAYILKIEKGTVFYEIKDSLNLFSDDEQAAFYEYAVNALNDLGYDQYEISNFSKPGFESKHNLKYWRDEEYLGIGPSAHSFLDGERFYYPDSLEAFYSDKIIYESEGGDIEEYIMLALRLSEGLIFKNFEERFGSPLPRQITDRAKLLCKQGLVEISDERIRLTIKGFLVSNSVIAYLLK